MAGHKRQWLRPLKLREYYVDAYVPNLRDAQHQLYWAVVDGKLRARHKGRILTSEEANALHVSEFLGGRVFKRWSDCPTELYALPADIELSVEDAERIWGDLSLMARGRVAAVASVVLEVAGPGRKAGEHTPKRQMCDAATTILSSGDVPRGHGRVAKIARRVREKFPQWPGNTIERYIRLTVRDWERNNPDK